jgi:hypothetical protein
VGSWQGSAKKTLGKRRKKGKKEKKGGKKRKDARKEKREIVDGGENRERAQYGKERI